MIEQDLHNIHVRKLVIMGLPPIGCAPHYLWRYSSQNGECVQEINDMIMEYNFGMRYMVEELRQELPDSNIIFCDLYQGSMDIIRNYDLYGNSLTPTLYLSSICNLCVDNMHRNVNAIYVFYHGLIQVSTLLLMLAVALESLMAG